MMRDVAYREITCNTCGQRFLNQDGLTASKQWANHWLKEHTDKEVE